MELSYPQGLNTIVGDLDDSLGDRVTRVLRTVVQAEMHRRRSVTPEDVEDVCSDAMVALLSRMERDTGEVLDIEAYAAGIARRACSAWSRRRYPAFHRLRTRLRYLLKTDPRFSLWQDNAGDWVCGPCSSATAPARPVDLDLFVTVSPSAKPAQAVAEIFILANQPIYFNDLSKVCARLWAIEDTPETIEAVETAAEPPEEAAPDRGARLTQLWSELRQLPPRQCAALLLNLRGPEGESATSLLIHTGTASLRALAQVLDMDPLTFAELYPRLPLSDLEIAERLQLTRQQVINLRKCARERLLRRMGPE